MNKLFIGLLIIAAGAGVFFLLRKKKNSTAANTINKEWIIGKWKATEGNDSAFNQYRYDFQKDGNLLVSPNDSARVDTFHYEWSKNNDLVWKETAADTSREIFSIVKLTQDSLQVQTKDSAIILFTKLK